MMNLAKMLETLLNSVPQEVGEIEYDDERGWVGYVLTKDGAYKITVEKA